MTLADLLKSSLRVLGIINPYETISDTLMQSTLQALNMMLSLWSARKIMVYAITSEDLALIVGNTTHTIGATGNFNTARPKEVVGCSIVDGGISYPLNPIGEEAYLDIPDKSSRGMPTSFWYNPTYPLGTFYFDFVPDKAYTFHLDSIKALATLTGLTTTVTLPDEYLAAIKWNLAVNVAPDFEKMPSPVVVKMAEESFDIISTMNADDRLEAARLNLFKYGDKPYNVFSDN